jgi:hypothetical protein
MGKIGLVTITYNSEKVISAFLQCVWKQTYENFNLYIVDNSSKDNTLQFLEKEKKTRLKLIRNTDNVGVAKANNQGIIKALDDGCSKILIINNDVEFEKDLIKKLIKFQDKKKCSLVVPKMMYYAKPKHIWYGGSWFNKKRGFLPFHRGLNQLDRSQFNQIIPVEYAPTCCLLINRQVFNDIGFMDEKYFVYFDDTDFCFRILKDGRHKIYYYPYVSFYHKVGSLTKSFNKNDGARYRGDFFIKQNTMNHIYFLRKVGSFFAYLYILWLFFRNNMRFIFSSRIKKNFHTWWLINNSYFKGIVK